MSERAVEFIRRFNQLNGKRHDVNSENLNQLVERAIGEFGEDLVAEVITKVREDSIYKVCDRFFLKDYLSKKQQPVAAETPKVESPADLTLGLIKQALGRVIFEEYAPKLGEEVYNRAVDLLKQNFGPLERKVKFSIANKPAVDVGITHEEFETCLSFVMADEPVMLVGPAGTGKNVIAKQIAKALDLNFYFSNSITQEYKLTGFVDAMGKFHDTEFYNAFTKGGLFFLDEIDASIPETIIILNAAIANRYFVFPHIGRVEANPNFRVIAAGNTYGHGASYQYVGRNQLDAATLNRFAIVEIGYSPKIENSLTADAELLSFARQVRRSCEKNGINHIVSYREISRLDKMLTGGLEVRKALKTCLVKNLQADDIKMIYGDLDGNNKYAKEFKKCGE